MAAHPLNIDRHGLRLPMPVLAAPARLCAAVLCLLIAFQAHAGSFVDLTVTGRVTPDACHIELTDEGIVDHGKIPSHCLNVDEFTVLP